eukprot:PITA_16638
MIHPQGKKKMMDTTSRDGPSAQQLQMDKVVEEYEDIFNSPTGVPLHYQVKHSIDLTLGPTKGGKHFTKIDLKLGYHQVPIGPSDVWETAFKDNEPSDVWKTAFKAHEGLLEWLIMSFGLTNSPTTFMRLMDDILRPFTNSFVVVYLDDILIFSQGWEEHLHHI